ncbi:hypothetical protein CG747_45350 [Streptomyces sp. CB02959]|nr:hypothetical protein CG747_45350 [Streptomyces sp. CB02959]
MGGVGGVAEDEEAGADLGVAERHRGGIGGGDGEGASRTVPAGSVPLQVSGGAGGIHLQLWAAAGDILGACCGPF